MTSARKNSEISINTEVYGALELIKNKILSNFSALMDDEQIKELKAAGLKDVVCVTPSILPAK